MKKWITNLPESEAHTFIADCGKSRNLIIDDPIATDVCTVDDLKRKPFPYVGIYEIKE